jgi:hypothetical protein
MFGPKLKCTTVVSTIYATGHEVRESAALRGAILAQLANATPFHGYTAKFAAERLLTAVWKAEHETSYEDYRGGRVDEEGLLTKTDIKNIEREVFGARE